MPSRSLCGQLHGTSYTCLALGPGAGLGPQLLQIGLAPAECLTLGVHFGLALARYAGEAQEGEVEPRYVSSANASESLLEEEARLGRESVRVYMVSRADLKGGLTAAGGT